MSCLSPVTALTQGVRGELQADTSIGKFFIVFCFSWYFFEIRTIKFLFANWLAAKGYDGGQLWKKIEVSPFTVNETAPV